MSGKRTLIIAEKPGVARDIADVLGKFTRKDGYLENGDYIITWAVGHLAELASPEDYHPGLKKWSLNTLPIIPEAFFIKPIDSKKQHFRKVKSLFKRTDVNLVINACDAGREGELIFRYIYYLAECRKPFKRLWLSENTPEAIKRAFSKLKDGSCYDSLFAAAQARARADWLVGMNATRAYTLNKKDKMTVGRVQTPALALLVEREKEIRSFIQKVYWELWGHFVTPEGDMFRARWSDTEDGNSVFLTLDEAENIRTALSKEKVGFVTSFETKDSDVPAPPLYNLDDLQQDANRHMGMTAARTLEIAQVLYERKKLITYPRTDSRFITGLLAGTLMDRLSALSKVDAYEELARKAAGFPLPEAVVNDAGVTDHHAIIPTYVVPGDRLSIEERSVYDLVARRFMAVFYPPAMHRHSSIFISVKGHQFHAKGSQVIKPGWEEVYTGESRDSKSGDDKNTLPALNEGMQLNLASLSVEEKKIRPPGRFTDASLLKGMKNAGRTKELGSVGLGTPATRAGIIEKLISAGYVQRDGKRLAPTVKGEELVGQVSEELKSPRLTVRWEELLSEIEQGKADAKIFMRNIEYMVRTVVDAAAGRGGTVGQ